MSHTYSSCYRVAVPPFALDGSARQRGVRLREELSPLAELRDFRVLYLGRQLQADAAAAAAESTAAAQKPPGWTAHLNGAESSAHSSDAALLESSDPFRAADLQLNGSAASKARHAIRHSFYPLRGADNSTVFGVRYQRAAHHAQRVSSQQRAPLGGDTLSEDGGAVATVATSSSGDEEGNPLEAPGVPWWMRTEPSSVSLPRSSTKDAFRGIPSESFLLDQRFFHETFQRDAPVTPALPRSGATMERGGARRDGETVAQRQRRLAHEHLVSAAAMHPRTERLRKLPLFSSQQPSLFFRVPHPQAHPQLYRNSATLREEARRDRQAQEPAHLLLQQQKQGEEPRSNGGLTERTSSRHGRAGRHLAPSVPSRPLTTSGAATARTSMRPAPPAAASMLAPAAPAGSMSARAATSSSSAAPPPSSWRSGVAAPLANGEAEFAPPPLLTTQALPSFREHMQAARQRWAAEQTQRDLDAGAD